MKVFISQTLAEKKKGCIFASGEGETKAKCLITPYHQKQRVGTLCRPFVICQNEVISVDDDENGFEVVVPPHPVL